MYVLFMSTAVMKQGGAWDIMIKVFKIKISSFELLIIGFVTMLAPYVQSVFFDDVAEEHTYSDLCEGKKQFKKFDYAIEADDVTFQRANCPSWNMQEGKKYYFGKHKLYGYKVKVAVRANGLACWYSIHNLGSVSNITILSYGVQEYQTRTRKSSNAKTIG